MESFIDIIGQIIFYLAFLMPVLMILWFWQIRSWKIPVRILAGLATGLFFGFLMIQIAIAIAFRYGLGPA